MTDREAAAITHIAPLFVVSNYVVARDFYADKLGFEDSLSTTQIATRSSSAPDIALLPTAEVAT